MNKFVFSVCLFLFSLAGFAQGSTLLEAEEDSTISVIAYFSTGDTLVYDFVHYKQRIKEADTITTVNVTTRFLVTVTDSTSEGYKMVFVPQSIEKGETAYSDGALQMEDLLTIPLGVKCQFSTDELGVIQHIDNWMEIRDTLKVNTKKIFDEVYAQNPGLDSILPRQRMESTFLLRCSSESGILNIYAPLEMMFNLHGAAYSMKKNRVETKDELGYPAYIDIEAYYTVPEDDTDNEGDYAIVAETTTDMKGDDLMDIVGAAVGSLVNDSVVGQLNESLKSDDFAKMQVKGLNHELYTYFYNGWPKVLVNEKRVGIDGKDALIDKHVMVWVSLHWNEYVDEEDDGEKQDI